MSAKNKKLKPKDQRGLRAALTFLATKARTGLTAMGVQGVVAAVVIAAAAGGLYLARREVAAMPHFRVYPARFRATGPKWCADDLAKVAFPRESYSVFDPELTLDVARAYLASPWVKAVRSVEKRFPSEMHVELELREPAAFIRLPASCYAVDDEGIRLPLEYEAWDHITRPLPLIFGVRGDPPEAGKRWVDAGTLAALAVLRALAAEPALLSEIHFVDVSNLDGVIDPQRSEVMLFTRRRVRIAWGRAPDTAHFGEPSVANKLARLRQWLARPLALSGGAAHIDLRFPEDPALARQ